MKIKVTLVCVFLSTENMFQKTKNDSFPTSISPTILGFKRISTEPQKTKDIYSINYKIYTLFNYTTNNKKEKIQ